MLPARCARSGCFPKPGSARLPAAQRLIAAAPVSALDLRFWWARQGSNLRPKDYESPALTTELRAPTTARTLGDDHSPDARFGASDRSWHTEPVPTGQKACSASARPPIVIVANRLPVE